MKREEAVEIIKKWLMEGTYGLTENRLGYIEGWFYKEDAEAFEMAIKVLEQEPVLDKVKAEIEKQEKWLMSAGCNVSNAYNVYTAFNSIKSVLEESRDKE